MKVLIIIHFQLFLICQAQQNYDRRYDYFDVDFLIQNPRLLKKYLECFLEKGPCPPIGWVFKRVLPEVVATKCAKCTPRQRQFARKAIKAFQFYFPEEHQLLKAKLDPQNKYYRNFEKAIGAV